MLKIEHAKYRSLTMDDQIISVFHRMAPTNVKPVINIILNAH